MVRIVSNHIYCAGLGSSLISKEIVDQVCRALMESCGKAPMGSPHNSERRQEVYAAARKGRNGLKVAPQTRFIISKTASVRLLKSYVLLFKNPPLSLPASRSKSKEETSTHLPKIGRAGTR